ncbi:hypothetical protein JOQ06_004968 [Pogonophryne albipinna]|uniref:DDE Tnp4 domain-containing protein n=1 Tax=Pogonophryne albipinna TaxID=1090488 RepID=A0AAD6APK9_9TELE|nr:hypothetical protein JOQ06_004968 [Pogonophryne albipinna]
MSLGKKLRARIEGKETKCKTLKLIQWLQKKHLLKKNLRCSHCHHKMKMVSVTKKDQYMWCLWVQSRSSHWWHDAVETWTDRQWQKNFRMKRTTFLHLCDLLRPSLIRNNTRYRQPIPVELRVAICLWRLATNLEFRSLSHLFGIGISTACLITQEVTTAINNTMGKMLIKVPTAAQLRAIMQAFRDKWHFPQVVGTIDGTHIGILAPSDTPADYYNRKGFHSVILQGVVDHHMMFWDINIGFSGKVHDARVFANSSLYRRAQAGTLLPQWTETFEGVDVPLVILGDSAYPLLPWLMKYFTTFVKYTMNTLMSKRQFLEGLGRLVRMELRMLHPAQQNQAHAGRDIRNAMCAYFARI